MLEINIFFFKSYSQLSSCNRSFTVPASKGKMSWILPLAEDELFCTEFSSFYNLCAWSYAVGAGIASEKPGSIKPFWSLNPLFQGDTGSWDRPHKGVGSTVLSSQHSLSPAGLGAIWAPSTEFPENRSHKPAQQARSHVRQSQSNPEVASSLTPPKGAVLGRCSQPHGVESPIPTPTPVPYSHNTQPQDAGNRSSHLSLA